MSFSRPAAPPVLLSKEGGAKAMQSARSRRRILQAACSLLAHNSFDGTGVAAIARKAGLPVTSIYWHFGSKAGLLAAVMEESSRRLIEIIPAIDHLAGTPEERFARWFDELLEAFLSDKHRQVMRLAFSLSSELLRDSATPMVEAARRARRRDIDILREVLAAVFAPLGESEAGRIADELARVVHHFSEGSIMAYLTDPAGTDMRRLFSNFRDAILALAAQSLARGSNAEAMTRPPDHAGG